MQGGGPSSFWHLLRLHLHLQSTAVIKLTLTMPFLLITVLQSCMLPMGVTSENVAAKFGVSRKTQDEFAVRSHRKAAAAQAAGKFKASVFLCDSDPYIHH